MRTLPRLLIIIVLQMLLGQGPGFAQADADSVSVPVPEIVLNTYLEKGTAALNETILFHVEMSWVGKMSRYQITEIPQPILTNLMMKGSGSTNRLETLPGGGFRSHKIITYQFRPVEMGMAYIDGIEVRYIDMVTKESDVLRSQRVSVEITEALPEDTGGVSAVIYIVLLTVFGATVLYFVIQYLRRRKQSRVEAAPQVCNAEKYLEKIAQDIDPKGTNLGEMVVRLSRLFREFLVAEFELQATATASQDLLEGLKQKNLPDEQIDRLNELFQKLDVIKFGGGEVDPAEFSMIYGTIEAFLIERKKSWESEHPEYKEA